MKLVDKKKKIYFIGIGGIGMSGIAEILFEMGYSISGSDQNKNNNTARLEKIGIDVNYGHKNTNILKFDIVVISSAILKNNLELIKARKNNIPILPRAKMLSEIMRLKSSITIAGSHGKTTTTSMISCIFEDAGLDPTVINGGIINTYNTNAKLGNGDWVIAEADESDGSFTYLPSTICLINNIDPEHLDYYGSYKNLVEAFLKYAENVPFYGFISLCIDHKNTKDLIPKLLNKKIVTFGLNKTAEFTANNISIKEINGIYYTKFDALINQTKFERIKNIIVPILGDHNLTNILGAISIAKNLGIKKNQIKHSLKNFKGVKRRFTLIDEINGVKIFDDYAHHPKEISATLSTLKKITHGKVIAIYEPHRYTRLKELFDDFSKCFRKCDALFLLPVFPAGEKRIPLFNSKKLASAVRVAKTGKVFNSSSKHTIYKNLLKIMNPKDNVIFLGAGPITKLANEFPSYIREN